MLLNLYNLLITFFILHLLPLKDQRCVLDVTETILILNRKIIDSRELREGGRIRLFRDEKEHGLHQTSAIVYS